MQHGDDPHAMDQPAGGLGNNNDDKLVVHQLRLIGFGQPLDIAARMGTSSEIVTSSLKRSEKSGWCRFRLGHRSGWVITSAGRSTAEQHVHEQLRSTQREHVFNATYERFLNPNTDFVRSVAELSTRLTRQSASIGADDWNHIASLVGACQTLIAEFSSTIPRFERYDSRFSRALNEAQREPFEWILSARRDSLHTIWFELHEDLLATIGRSRSSELS